MNLGLSAVHTSDELRSFSIPATIIKIPADGYNWILSGHIIGEVTAARTSRTRSEQNCSSKTDFETRRENQYFERQNISMSRPPLGSTPFGTNTTNRTTSSIDSIPVGTKIPETTPPTRPTDSPILPTDSSEQTGKAHVPGDLDPDPSSSDSSSKQIRRMIAIPVNKLKRNVIRRKIVGNTRNRTRKTHRRAILIRVTTVTKYTSGVKRRATGKRIR